MHISIMRRYSGYDAIVTCATAVFTGLSTLTKQKTIMLNLDRQSLRKKILTARNNLDAVERNRKSMEITENLWRLDKFCQTKTLFIYVNFRSEVETLPLINQCLKKGLRVAVPLTLPGEGRLLPYLITDPRKDLLPGYCDIPEPDSKRLSVLNPQEIEVVILPGSVFDAHGGRLGYGGGYYDKFLANDARQAVRIGLAFELQMVAEVPLLPHDQRLNYLITEKRTIKTGE